MTGQKHCSLLLAITIFELVATGCSTQQIKGDDLTASAKLMEGLNESFTKCGDAVYTRYRSQGHVAIYQLKGFEVELTTSKKKFDKLDTLNGYQWQGTFELSSQMSRAWHDGTWGDWGYELPYDLRQVSTRKFTKKNGEWSGDWWLNPVTRRNSGVGDTGVYFDAISCADVPPS